MPEQEPETIEHMIKAIQAFSLQLKENLERSKDENERKKILGQLRRQNWRLYRTAKSQDNNDIVGLSQKISAQIKEIKEAIKEWEHVSGLAKSGRRIIMSGIRSGQVHSDILKHIGVIITLCRGRLSVKSRAALLRDWEIVLEHHNNSFLGAAAYCIREGWNKKVVWKLAGDSAFKYGAGLISTFSIPSDKIKALEEAVQCYTNIGTKQSFKKAGDAYTFLIKKFHSNAKAREWYEKAGKSYEKADELKLAAEAYTHVDSKKAAKLYEKIGEWKKAGDILAWSMSLDNHNQRKAIVAYEKSGMDETKVWILIGDIWAWKLRTEKNRFFGDRNRGGYEEKAAKAYIKAGMDRNAAWQRIHSLSRLALKRIRTFKELRAA